MKELGGKKEIFFVVFSNVADDVVLLKSCMLEAWEALFSASLY